MNAAGGGPSRGRGAASSRCPCASLRNPIELALCLAPPPGEHELVLEAGPGTLLVLDSERGFHLRSVSRDEFLPFLSTVERPASRISIEAALERLGLQPEDLPRLAAEKLLEAAGAGSREAAAIAAACRGLLEALLRRGLARGV